MGPQDASGSRERGTRLFVIIGEPHEPFTEPPYPTDPRHYGLPLFKRPVTNEEFESHYRDRVKAFLDRDHAITFAYHCNLVGVRCPVYEWNGDEWVYNKEETGRVAEDIN
jgi:hypothetical protein